MAEPKANELLAEPLYDTVYGTQPVLTDDLGGRFAVQYNKTFSGTANRLKPGERTRKSE